MPNNIDWKDNIISAAQNYWVVSIEQNKKIKSSLRRFEFTASSIIRMNEKGMTFKIKKMFFFPLQFETHFENMVGLSTYIARRKPLERKEVLAMIEKPILRKKDRKKASILKWSIFGSIIFTLFLIATLVVVFTY